MMSDLTLFHQFLISWVIIPWLRTNERSEEPKNTTIVQGILKILRTLNSSKGKDIHFIPGSINVLFPDIISGRFLVLANPKVPENLAKEWLPSLLPSKSPATMSAWISKNHTSTLINDLKHLDVFPETKNSMLFTKNLSNRKIKYTSDSTQSSTTATVPHPNRFGFQLMSGLLATAHTIEL